MARFYTRFTLISILLTTVLVSCDFTLPSLSSQSSTLLSESTSALLSSESTLTSSDIISASATSSEVPVSSAESSSSITTTSSVSGTEVTSSVPPSTSVTATSSSPTSTNSLTISSNAPTYYNGISPSLTGSSLKSSLQVLLNSNYTVTYNWERYLYADESWTDTSAVITIYPKVNYPKENRVGSSQPPGYWNREHTYPQSKISTTAASDTHHIFADDHSTNSQRGNKRFGDVANTEANRVKDSLNRPTNNFQTSTYFEPNDQAKGEVARATLYLNTLYGISLDGNFETAELAVVWALNYPVDDWSQRRNNRVYDVQGNRNPYIDRPEWICAVYGTTSNATRQACGL